MIERKRLERNMTLRDLAEEMCISESALSRRLNGETAFTVEDAANMFAALDFNMEDILIFANHDGSQKVQSYFQRIYREKSADR